jgi:hypothetical protein
VEGEGAAKKESAQRPGAQAKLPVAASSKEVQEEEEEEDPFAPEKGIPRSNSEGKGTSGGSCGREEEGEFTASDAKSDRYSSGMADSKDSNCSK